MAYCCNYGCSNIPFGTKKRCGACRRRKIQSCSQCGLDVMEPAATKCGKCYAKRRKIILTEANTAYRKRNKIDKPCKNCGVLISDKFQKNYCSIQCADEVRDRYLKARREHSNCIMCDKDITNTNKRMVCSDECYMYYRKIYNAYSRGYLITLN